MLHSVKGISWLVALAANGFVVFLWAVFGLAAIGQNGDGAVVAFILATAIGVGLPISASVVLMSRDRYILGVAIVFATLPSVLVLMAIFERFIFPHSSNH